MIPIDRICRDRGSKSRISGIRRRNESETLIIWISNPHTRSIRLYSLPISEEGTSILFLAPRSSHFYDPTTSKNGTVTVLAAVDRVGDVDTISITSSLLKTSQIYNRFTLIAITPSDVRTMNSSLSAIHSEITPATRDRIRPISTPNYDPTHLLFHRLPSNSLVASRFFPPPLLHFDPSIRSIFRRPSQLPRRCFTDFPSPANGDFRQTRSGVRRFASDSVRGKKSQTEFFAFDVGLGRGPRRLIGHFVSDSVRSQSNLDPV
ncbi:hypothetical protein LXL04_020151 [Taraxacum kok-saghyz]